MRVAPAPLYAGLFVEGARFTYTVETDQSHWDDQNPSADAQGNVEASSTGTMTCTVTEVRELPSAIASRIECDGDVPTMVGDSPWGVYVATADGLWKVPEMPSVAPTTKQDQLLAWPPAAREIDVPDPKNPGWGSKIIVAQEGKRWCWNLTFISGDEGDASICVGDGVITSGAASSSGGSSYGMRYTLRKSG